MLEDAKEDLPDALRGMKAMQDNKQMASVINRVCSHSPALELILW